MDIHWPSFPQTSPASSHLSRQLLKWPLVKAIWDSIFKVPLSDSYSPVCFSSAAVLLHRHVCVLLSKLCFGTSSLLSSIFIFHCLLICLCLSLSPRSSRKICVCLVLFERSLSLSLSLSLCLSLSLSFLLILSFSLHLLHGILASWFFQTILKIILIIISFFLLLFFNFILPSSASVTLPISIYPSVWPSLYLSNLILSYLSIYLSICLSICLSLSLCLSLF